MTCHKSADLLSLRQIADEYQGTGSVNTWRQRLHRNTGNLRSIARKVGGSTRIDREDLERYIAKPQPESGTNTEERASA